MLSLLGTSFHHGIITSCHFLQRGIVTSFHFLQWGIVTSSHFLQRGIVNMHTTHCKHQAGYNRRQSLGGSWSSLASVQCSFVATPLWGKCEVATHTPENGSLEFPGTPENSEDDCRGQNTSHWGVLYTVGKVLRCRCPKWPRMSHLDICSPSYGQKKGRESNWQFDSRPLKVGNRRTFNVRWGSAIRRWKALDKSYNIGSNLVPIRGRGEKLWSSKVLRVQTGTVSRLHFGSPGTKSHSDVASVE
jgi:hypothetical protein